MRYKKTLIFSFMVFALILGLFTISPVKGALADVTYTFNRDILYESDSPLFEDEFNMGNFIEYSDDYGVYSFINDTNWSDDPDNWVFTQGTGADGGVIPSLDGHNKVFGGNKTTTGAGHSLNIVQNFESAQTYGTIDFWIQQTNVDATHVNYVQLLMGGGGAAYLISQVDLWKYDDGAVKVLPNVDTPKEDIWQHIKIDFEMTAGGYLGMAQYQTIFTINGISSGAVNIKNNVANIDAIRFACSDWHSNYGFKVDGVGYSWLSNYTINDNIIPIFEVDDSQKIVDRFEFTMDGVNSKIPAGTDNPVGWTDVESSTDQVNVVIADDPSKAFGNMGVAIGAIIAPSNLNSLMKDDFALNTERLNITIGWNYSTASGTTSLFDFEVESSDSSLVLWLQCRNDGQMRWFTGFPGPYTLLRADITIDKYYEFNFYIDYTIDLCVFMYYVDGILIETYINELLTLGKEGLGKIEAEMLYADGNTGIIIDYIGVYDNGVPKFARDVEFGYETIDLGLGIGSNWDSENHNLFTIIANGNFSLGYVSPITMFGNTFYKIENTYVGITGLTEFYSFASTSTLFNLYGLNGLRGDPRIVATIGMGVFYNITYILVEGAKLTSDAVDYFLEFSQSGIDTNESYFYVDTANRLQFTHTANDTDLEYIQAEFNIPDISSDNYAIAFRSNIDNNAYGYFRVNFTDISNFIPIPIFDKTSRFFMTQNKTISSFIILITDEDLDVVAGLTEGYVSDIELLFIAGIGVGVTTSNLLTIIIPIIIIFIPTFLLSSRIGQNMIVPLMMLMSLICVATGIIPIWLFFVIVFPSSLFLFLKREELT